MARSTKNKRYTQIKEYSLAAIIVAIIVLPLLFAAFYSNILATVKGFIYQPHTRTYYIAAENTAWDYSPLGKDPMTGKPIPEPYGAQTTFYKVRYFGYTDSTFTHKLAQPEAQGILGPTIRGVVGDTIKVVFYNRSDKPYSIHPHGVAYDKDNEGAATDMHCGTFSGTDKDEQSILPVSEAADIQAQDAEAIKCNQSSSSMDGKGAKVQPGHQYTYTWQVRPESGPSKNQGGSRVWLYHSHVALHDIYDGLVGPIVISSPQHARKDGAPDDVRKEFFALFMIFDETQPYFNGAEREAATMHTINGRFYNNLLGYTMKQGERVRWYTMGLGNEVDLHTPHWHGNDVIDQGTTTDVIELLPATMKTVDMVPDAVGMWMFHCHVIDHMNAGMMADYVVTPKS